MYIENFGADAFPCASMLAGEDNEITVDGKAEFLDDEFTRSASL